jgi:predicted DNA-binding protein
MKNSTKHIAIRIPEDMDTMLNKFVEEQKTTKSYIIRKAIEQYLETSFDKLKFPSFKKSLRDYHKFNKRILADKILKKIED